MTGYPPGTIFWYNLALPMVGIVNDRLMIENVTPSVFGPRPEFYQDSWSPQRYPSLRDVGAFHTPANPNYKIAFAVLAKYRLLGAIALCAEDWETLRNTSDAWP